MKEHTNQLINETSPYLLQHAHNPVNWYPWGDEALNKAKQENKPILVSIGYAACHWCHVMERESFEDETTAKVMNDNFINIKIDREERPDLDHIYMDAVQAMTGSGGWPLNVFLTPEKKPFFGGTYFPPQRAFNKPSWQETLHGVIKAFRERRHEIYAQAENLTEHLLMANTFGVQPADNAAELFSERKILETYQNLMKSADTQWGGFGKAPKFPQTFSVQFLLRYYHFSKKESALSQALLSLDKMINGGIYDQVGGGFARYSTDTEWLAPHFEKMLYDNALLISVVSEAYQISGRHRYKEILQETTSFVQRELMHPDYGFYSALDADSEGVEGKFYTWSLAEVQEILGKDALLFCDYYDVTENGNWEHTTILWIRKSLEDFASGRNMNVVELNKLLSECRRKLFERRNERIRPSTDDKIILGWNALMNTACSKAFAATGIEEYRQLAINNMQFLLSSFIAKGFPELHHTWKNGIAKYPAFLDDYAFLIEALLHLHEITGDTKWLDKAKMLTEHVIENFSEPETGLFYYTPEHQQDVIVRKKEVYDSAVPSGNSVMAFNLHHISVLFDIKEWRERSRKMAGTFENTVIRYPTSFSNWACLLQEFAMGTNEIVVLGDNPASVHCDILRLYIPGKVLMVSERPHQKYPLLQGKKEVSKPTIYLCRNYTCKQPVFSAKELISLINKEQNQ